MPNRSLGAAVLRRASQDYIFGAASRGETGGRLRSVVVAGSGGTRELGMARREPRGSAFVPRADPRNE